MKANEMTSMQRVLTTLSHKEPDRVPLFLLPTMHGAKELGLSIKDYFSKAENVVEGQLRLRKKYRNDCIYTFFYAPLEIEAFGGEVIYSDDGPPNSGIPFINAIEDIKNLQPPKIKETKALYKVLQATQKLKEAVGDEAPIIGVVMSPFSLPVMQLGFDKYLELMHFHSDLFNHLMQINEEFCVDWANAQLQAGATAICYFDPVSSTTIIPRNKYLETGFQIAKRTISRIAGPTATHFASGKCLSIVDDVSQTGTAVVGTSSLEDIGAMKQACRGKLTILGNLNGIEMRRWSSADVNLIVKETIQKAAPGGGFILSDNHGEIPFQVPDEALMAISEAVHTFGKYPISDF
ncbi:MAG: uroporphyrinogen decarboxylase family protein [Bacteroidetes bacterium]|nr:uroporphyrinogen decarboxylase family protein [Bacteroidota bacterium]